MPVLIIACFFSALLSLLTLYYFFQDHRDVTHSRHWMSYIAAVILLGYIGWLYHFPLNVGVFWLLACLPLLSLMLLWCRPAQNLLLFCLPSLSAQALTYPIWFNLQSIQAGWLYWLHYYMAIFTCSMLVITVLLTAVYALKLLGLKANTWQRWVHFLPDLQTLEHWVGLTFLYGFLVLTMTLISGVFWGLSRHAALVTTTSIVAAGAWVLLALLGFAWHHLKWRGLKIWSLLWVLSATVVVLFIYSGY